MAERLQPFKNGLSVKENNAEHSSSAQKGANLLSNLHNFTYQRQPKPVLSAKGVPKCNPNLSLPKTWNIAANCNNSVVNATNFTASREQKRKIVKDNNEKDLPASKREKVELPVSQVKEDDRTLILERKIEVLECEFSSLDRMVIQDALVAANWIVEKASEQLRKTTKCIPGINETETSPEVAKKWRRIRPAIEDEKSSSDDDENPCEVSANVISVSDEDVSDEENYTSVQQTNILTFLSQASIPELVLVPTLSVKKVESIIQLRPFKDWKHLNEKIDENCVGVHSGTLFENVLETIQLQNEISVLMKSCCDLSNAMTNKLSKLSSYREANVMSLGEQPKSLSSSLKLATYQMIGLGWLRLLNEQGVNGILADEMGLGKTVQVIAFLAYLKEQNLKSAVHLIVVPSSTLENWSNELKRWCPDLKVELYYGSQGERRSFRFWWRDDNNKEEVDDIDILVTTYNLVSSTTEDKLFFRKMRIQYIIYDEAHMLKNMGTQRYESLMKISAKHRILLTGTPLQNNLVELMSLLVFVMPQMFAHKQESLKRLFKASPKGTNDQDTSNFESERIILAKKIMEPFILRRLKSDVLKDLPTKTEETLLCELTPAQSELYDEVMNELQDGENEESKSSTTSANGSQEEDGVESSNLSGSMAIMMRLRRAANHPALIRNKFSDDCVQMIAKKLKADRTYKEENLDKILDNLYEMSDHQIHQLCCDYKSISEFQLDKDYLLSSGKLEKLDLLLPKLQSEGHRVLIFSQFRQVMDILEDYCLIRGYKYLRLDGQTPVIDRQSLVDQYNKDDSILVFLLSTRAGGFGINLCSADTVIIHDIDLNPYNDKQAEDRCHRVGQVRPVTVLRLISSNTIEQAMLKIAQCKLSLEQQISQGRNSKESEKKLMQLLKEELKQCH